MWSPFSHQEGTTPNVESELRFYSTFWTGFGVLALMGLELTLPLFIVWAQARVSDPSAR